MMSNVYTNSTRERFLARQRKHDAERARERQQHATATTLAVVETIRRVSEPFTAVGVLAYDPRTDELRGAA